MMENRELVVIGGGPAGMAAALAAKRTGVKNIIILEQNEYIGGILPQCLHKGFGVRVYECDLTGPEYAERQIQEVHEEGIEYKCCATVMKILPTDFDTHVVEYMEAARGLCTINAKAIVIATGCREKTLPQLHIPGSRPAGIYMAGSAQYMINIANLKPGNSFAIMGLGDIGMIMARRLKLEGMNVKIIFGTKANGLVRNYIQCIRDFDIEARLGYTLVSTHGVKRLKGITIAPLDDNGNADLSKKEYIHCDTLLVAAGLEPETELFDDLYLDKQLHGIPADVYGATPIKGIFACGNARMVYDLVDKVTAEGMRTGLAVSQYLSESSSIVQQHHSNYVDKINRLYNDIGKYTPNKMMNRLPSDDCFVCTKCPNGCILMKNGDRIEGYDCSRKTE